MHRSDARLDAPRDLVRVEHRDPYTGWLGSLRGAEFARGVAQNGMALVEAQRLISCGVPLRILGPWEPLAPPPIAPAPIDPPALAAASSAPPARPAAPPPAVRPRR